MKTSVIEVHDMLAVFSVDEVEKRIGEVPGVASVTLNHAAGDATVRYDETRLAIGDIKSVVRQRGYEPVPAAGAPAGAHEGHDASGAPPLAAPAAAKPKAPPVPPATAGTASVDATQDKASSAVAPVAEKAVSGDASKNDKAGPAAASSGTEAGPKKLK